MIELTVYGNLSTTWFHTSIRILVRLAQQDGYISSNAMSEELGIDASFIRKVLNPLMKENLVTRASGRYGGYQLAKPPNTISLFEVYQALVNNALDTKRAEQDYTSVALSRILSETEQEFTKVLRRHMLDELYELK
ncbi:Rrf2 family protein [Paenibacillus cellulosilyticus]|uniref:Rrf2 family protein n=1 Tax=Paenibacillus cellulosilyticus TaxID=375489 RepID=A0A2V2Z1I8_9BACL|nr:Rrf2 family transcriptional regulator [Paenibacillus cellulosilyticus]PWW08727.1 Rrf2 family protein [Paenibacillus cellulosilyticus]QKS48291.1 Rrf2 family transcriptional regulator [Paenibacillus cellulosilyticus]